MSTIQMGSSSGRFIRTKKHFNSFKWTVSLAILPPIFFLALIRAGSSVARVHVPYLA